MTKTKKCTKCLKRRDVLRFSKSDITKDGLRYWCKSCCIADVRRYEKENDARDGIARRPRKFIRKKDRTINRKWLNMKAVNMLCDEWISDFYKFRDWLKSNGFRKGKFLRRIEWDKPYSPENCFITGIMETPVFADKSTPVTAWGESKLPIRWQEDRRCRVGYATICRRIGQGWTPEEAIGTLSRGQGKKFKSMFDKP